MAVGEPIFQNSEPVIELATKSNEPEQVTQQWVEEYIVPHLRALSRQGVLILFDSGVEPLTRGVNT
jgi:hypothetical protein